MVASIIIGIACGLVVAGATLYGWWRWQQRHGQNLFQAQAQQALGIMMQEVVKTAREQLSAERREVSDSLAKDLRQQSDTFRELTQSLKQEIESRQQEIRQLEEDRNRKYGQIAQALTDYKVLTEELRTSTEHLKRVLSNNQLRGNWGEMQAEKILEAAGMTEGIHYAKQRPIAGQPDLRPDFTLFLPNKMELYVDVKFPLQSLQLAMAATDKPEVDRHLQAFSADIRLRIKEVAKYLIDQPASVDYVILFVPSESVFEVINKHFPSVVDTSFSQRVIMTSPHSFFAVVRTIQESYAHFFYEQNLREILRYLQDLLANFQRFKGEFAEVGKALQSAQVKYEQISTTRYRQMDRIAEKITTYQLESDHLASESSSALPPLVAPALSDDEDVT